jgi:RNAse (barnase) inhibitor barstar
MSENPRRPVVYEIPGEQVTSLEDFYRVIGEAINGPGGYFGSNLDALWDCLRGDFGTPAEGGFTIRWLRSDLSRKALGYPETIRQLELRLAHCHPDNRELVRQDLDRAHLHAGPTVFDWLVDLIREADEVDLELR